MSPFKRRAAGISAALLLALTSSACGGDGDDDTGGGDSAPDEAADVGAPEDANIDEFCELLLDPAGPETAEAANELADRYADVGTPGQIAGDAREGFEIFIERLSNVSDDDFEEFKDFEEPAEVFDGADAEKVSAYFSKAVEVCLSGLDDLPTEVGP